MKKKRIFIVAASVIVLAIVLFFLLRTNPEVSEAMSHVDRKVVPQVEEFKRNHGSPPPRLDCIAGIQEPPGNRTHYWREGQDYFFTVYTFSAHDLGMGCMRWESPSKEWRHAVEAGCGFGLDTESPCIEEKDG